VDDVVVDTVVGGAARLWPPEQAEATSADAAIT
jgi:hypothetical protein